MKELLCEVVGFLESLSLEKDEDSCVGNSFLAGTISEDCFYCLFNRLKACIETKENNEK